MNRRRTAPVLERKQSGVSQQRSHRLTLMQEVRRLEWEFDKGPTLQVAGRLSNLRREVSALELEIAQVSEESAISATIARLEKLASLADSIDGGEPGSLTAAH